MAHILSSLSSYNFTNLSYLSCLFHYTVDMVYFFFYFSLFYSLLHHEYLAQNRYSIFKWINKLAMIWSHLTDFWKKNNYRPTKHKPMLSNFKGGFPSITAEQVLDLAASQQNSQRTHFNFVFKPSNFPFNPSILLQITTSSVLYKTVSTPFLKPKLIPISEKVSFPLYLIFYLLAFNFRNQNQNKELWIGSIHTRKSKNTRKPLYYRRWKKNTDLNQ